MSLFTKIFGTSSQREVKAITPLVDKIESLEEKYKALTDQQLQAKTPEFKERLQNGETLDDILPEAFAACREAAWRVLGMRPYRVQLIGGIILLVTSQKGVQGAPAPAGAAAGMGSGKAPARGGRGPVEKRAVLRGVTGKYSGQSFDLLKGKVVIGRDPATCNIVFDKNTPGISGRHCQVVYDPNEDCFIITDLGSSYGTFLGNGKKLTANVAEKLSTGDTFYLCDNANRFVVSKE